MPTAYSRRAWNLLSEAFTTKKGEELAQGHITWDSVVGLMKTILDPGSCGVNWTIVSLKPAYAFCCLHLYSII
jgi:hypothetical protein